MSKMKIGKKLALVLGIATGAIVAIAMTGRAGKRTRQYISRRTQDEGAEVKQTSEKYDDSEVHYI